ncbi:transcriptional regulator, partial [Halobium palmae]
MQSQTTEAVTGWDGEPFAGGYAGLHDLADREFTGAVTEGSAWAFMLNGKVVAVVDGAIEAFDGADGTAYRAPDPALPLLYAMKERGGEVRAQYYTNDTPLSEVDSTLSSGNFTGYVELSENVLSGDYYVVYYGGKSMSVAYVGNSRTLVGGEEAFERADDEVGIYDVREASIEIVDVPEPADQGAEEGAG